MNRLFLLVPLLALAPLLAVRAAEPADAPWKEHVVGDGLVVSVQAGGDETHPVLWVRHDGAPCLVRVESDGRFLPPLPADATPEETERGFAFRLSDGSPIGTNGCYAFIHPQPGTNENSLLHPFFLKARGGFLLECTPLDRRRCEGPGQGTVESDDPSPLCGDWAFVGSNLVCRVWNEGRLPVLASCSPFFRDPWESFNVSVHCSGESGYLGFGTPIPIMSCEDRERLRVLPPRAGRSPSETPCIVREVSLAEDDRYCVEHFRSFTAEQDANIDISVSCPTYDWTHREDSPSAPELVFKHGSVRLSPRLPGDAAPPSRTVLDTTVSGGVAVQRVSVGDRTIARIWNTATNGALLLRLKEDGRTLPALPPDVSAGEAAADIAFRRGATVPCADARYVELKAASYGSAKPVEFDLEGPALVETVPIAAEPEDFDSSKELDIPDLAGEWFLRGTNFVCRLWNDGRAPYLIGSGIRFVDSHVDASTQPAGNEGIDGMEWLFTFMPAASGHSGAKLKRVLLPRGTNAVADAQAVVGEWPLDGETAERLRTARDDPDTVLRVHCGVSPDAWIPTGGDSGAIRLDRCVQHVYLSPSK